MKPKNKLNEMEKILAKQTEVLCHQKHFNLILAVATTFLVLIYALKEAPHSRWSNAIFVSISVIMIIVLMVLFIFMMKEKYPEKIFRLFLSYFGK